MQCHSRPHRRDERSRRSSQPSPCWYPTLTPRPALGKQRAQRHMLAPVMVVNATATAQAICALFTRQDGSAGPASSSTADSATQAAGDSPLSGSSTEGGLPPEDAGPAGGFPRLYSYEVVRELPHQADAFTQGLEYDKQCAKTAKGDGFECTDIFWESTGAQPPRARLL